MPKVNGIEAVNEIITKFPEAKIIMVSALDQKHMVLEALKCGAKHYIIKPINPEKLVAVINKVLGIEPQTTDTIKSETVKEMEPIKAQVEEEPANPFIIKNINSVFNIEITKSFSIDNAGSLLQATQGLLYVQPLNVVIDFGIIEVFSIDLLNKIAEITNLILGANGKVTLTSQNKKFINFVKEKHISGLSKLFIE